jgi:hypothetical protein
VVEELFVLALVFVCTRTLPVRCHHLVELGTSCLRTRRQQQQTFTYVQDGSNERPLPRQNRFKDDREHPLRKKRVSRGPAQSAAGLAVTLVFLPPTKQKHLALHSHEIDLESNSERVNLRCAIYVVPLGVQVGPRTVLLHLLVPKSKPESLEILERHNLHSNVFLAALSHGWAGLGKGNVVAGRSLGSLYTCIN